MHNIKHFNELERNFCVNCRYLINNCMENCKINNEYYDSMFSNKSKPPKEIYFNAKGKIICSSFIELIKGDVV